MMQRYKNHLKISLMSLMLLVSIATLSGCGGGTSGGPGADGGSIVGGDGTENSAEVEVNMALPMAEQPDGTPMTFTGAN